MAWPMQAFASKLRAAPGGAGRGEGVMGVFSALTTAVSGMQAQSYALENISGNIANSRTAGFKRVDTTFADLVPDAALNRQISGSVAAYSQATNTIQGDLNADPHRHQCRDQRRRLLRRRPAAERRRRQHAVLEQQSLHPSRRFRLRRQWLSGQWRRLLSQGPEDRHGDRPARSAPSPRCCASPRSSSRPRRRPRSSIAPIFRPIRRPTMRTQRSPGPSC